MLVGIASSGVHSNGYSLVRKLVLTEDRDITAPVEAFGGKSWGETLLAPTKIYVKSALAACKACDVHGIAHITGGGITENLNRALNSQVNAQVDLGTWPVPAIAKYVCEAADLSEGQALKTFNMGVGMVLIVDPDRADEVEAALAKACETTYRVGRIVAGAGEVEYTGEGNLYGYEG